MTSDRHERVGPADASATDPTVVPSPSGSRASGVSRRGFLGGAAGAGAVSLLAGPLGRTAGAQTSGSPDISGFIGAGDALGPETGPQRRQHAYSIRVRNALENRAIPLPFHQNNGDEDLYPNKIASFSKGLPHDAFGEVNLTAYGELINALQTGVHAHFEGITMGNPNVATRFKLVNPQSGLGFDTEGADSHALALPPAPTFDSAWEAGEIVENYWMALLRDVPFSQYASNALALQAAADLSSLSDFRGPKVAGQVTPETLFRETMPGTLFGPYISQFLWIAQPFGSQHVQPRMQTAAAGLDYMTSQTDWLALQNGVLPPSGNVFDGTLRYIRNGRDMGQWVHVDVLFQAYFQAMLSMLQGPNSDPLLNGLNAPLNPTNPYNTSDTQFGFGTLGGPFIATILCEVATRALKAVWFQKWFVHHRLRPEVFAGRVHYHLTGQKSYPIHADVLNSQAVAQVFSNNGTYLLPMAFPEGSPTHPAYGAGHATVAGACVTVLKALFDGDRPYTDVAQPVIAADDGLSLLPYMHPDGAQMTIAGELNKLAMNVALGRNIAGVHWRTDGIESLLLGERVAINVLRDHLATFNEPIQSFQFTGFDGMPVTIAL